jgi:hypothetical protein
MEQSRNGDPCMDRFELSHRNEILTRKTQDNPFAYLEKLPFRIGSDAWKQRLKEARKNKEKAKAINCFSASKYEILGRRLTVRIFNEKTQHWQEEIAVEYHEICPICGSLMLVRAIQGTTWLALCSTECYEKYAALKKEVGV